jgi:hypothetical protein
MFLCLRNPDQVPLHVSAPRPPVPADLWDILAQPQFAHRASPSHGGADLRCPRAPILFGAENSPNIRINFANLDRSQLGEREEAAFSALDEMLRHNAVDLPLQAADCVILDNMRTVHGRRSFSARFDGSDRWLKRAIVSRDLRRCAAWSSQPSARMLGAAYA